MAEVEAVQLKEEGNRHFQLQDYKAATKSYSQALKLTKDKALLATLYRNRAACGLKTESYVQAASDASRAIDINSSDIKALYRRCQALEHLGKLDQAFKDVQRCATLEPRNQNFQETLRRLNTNIQEKLRVQFSTDLRVQKMFEILLDENSEADKREKAANNLIVLGREEAGAEKIFQNNGVALLLQLLDTKKPELVLAAVRTLSGMCSGHRARATVILHAVRIDRICSLMAVENEEMSLAVCNLLQAIIDSLSGEDKREHRGKEEALVLDTKKDLKQITSHLLDMLVSKKVSGQGRDQALNLLNKNVPRKDLAIHDNSRTIYVVDNGLRKILKVVGQVPDLPSCLPLTDNTRMLASILINKLYDDLRCDPERDHFRKICEEYITGKFDPQDMDKNLNAIQTVSGILQGPFDLGNQLLGLKGVMEMMVALCGSERETDQLVAVEALIHASTKLSRATFIITNGVSLLKQIYKTTKNEKIKIRTLVGLCKLGSAGGTDYGLRQFAEGSTEKLAKQCRKWLCNTSIDTRTRRWAVEGLAYLTLDADVKDDFVQDIPALQAMFELAKTSDKTILYSVATTLVNCTNSYDVKEVIPELVQLAKFSKQHVPEEHPKDKKDFIDMRVKRLLKAGVISALACMVKADSAILTDQTKELLARSQVGITSQVNFGHLAIIRPQVDTGLKVYIRTQVARPQIDTRWSQALGGNSGRRCTSRSKWTPKTQVGTQVPGGHWAPDEHQAPVGLQVDIKPQALVDSRSKVHMRLQVNTVPRDTLSPGEHQHQGRHPPPPGHHSHVYLGPMGAPGPNLMSAWELVFAGGLKSSWCLMSNLGLCFHLETDAYLDQMSNWNKMSTCSLELHLRLDVPQGLCIYLGTCVQVDIRPQMNTYASGVHQSQVNIRPEMDIRPQVHIWLQVNIGLRFLRPRSRAMGARSFAAALDKDNEEGARGVSAERLDSGQETSRWAQPHLQALITARCLLALRAPRRWSQARAAGSRPCLRTLSFVLTVGPGLQLAHGS
ncbi:protein unc-45 homolog B [Rhinopithecus roxellana]|uniref:protein unc-45 homolog B n=1 Tax=Rhinopithecus roxellana TaxID=61622 RepID=UPI0012379EE2|nr:protein unc-45 homolog B [Rhinopithecus roxellana]